MDRTSPLAQSSSTREVPLPKKGVRDDTRVVLGNGDRVLAFALSSRAHEGPHPSLWITQAGLHKIVFWMFGGYPTAIICALYKIDRCAEKDLIEAMQRLLAIIGGHRPPLQSRKLTARRFKVFDVVTLDRSTL